MACRYGTSDIFILYGVSCHAGQALEGGPPFAGVRAAAA